MKAILTSVSVIAGAIMFAFALGHTSNAAGHHAHCDLDEACVVTEMNPVQEVSEVTGDERTLSLSCPNCSKLMWATFKVGYGSTTIAKCEKCYSRFAIRYNWPRDHSEPTIFEIKKM